LIGAGQIEGMKYNLNSKRQVLQTKTKRLHFNGVHSMRTDEEFSGENNIKPLSSANHDGKTW
jgi:hypothetical protein